MLKFKYWLFSLFLVISVVCAFLIPKVVINYDTAKYLPDEMQTQQAIDVVSEEFGMTGYTEVMVSDISIEVAQNISLTLMGIENVKFVEFNPLQESSYLNKNALYKITFKEGNYDESTKQAIALIQDSLSEYTYFMKGEAITAQTYNQVIQDEILTILAFLIPIVLIILFLTTTSWIEPLIFCIVVLISIIINMGSNIMFDNISYMTHATCGVLQLAICMDYSVMLLHSYRKQKTDKATAIHLAVKESFIPILGSSLTTLVGFVALMTMTYKMGFDIGIVLAKGTIISLITAFFLMPSLIYMFDSLIKKTTHKNLIKESKWIPKLLYKTRFVIPIIALGLIVSSYFIQRNNDFGYSEYNFINESKSISESTTKINDAFGNRNLFSIIIPKDIIKEQQLIQNIQTLVTTEQVPLQSITSATIFYTKFDETTFVNFLTSYGISTEQTNQIMIIFQLMESQFSQTEFSIMDMMAFISQTSALSEAEKMQFAPFFAQFNQVLSSLSSDNYHRLILSVDLDIESKKTFGFVEKLYNSIKQTFPDDSYLLGESVAIYDIKEVVYTDYQKTSVLVIILIALAILFSFKSISIPIILVLLIQGSTWINMSVPSLLNQNLLFIGYVIVSCIMMGATIDYAILYANCYVNNRKERIPKEAMAHAFEETKYTVLTSGTILVVAGYALSFISTIPSIAIFGDLIGRGGLISILLVLFVLPQVMLIADKWIIKKVKAIE